MSDLYDDTALKEAVDRMAELIESHATKTYVDEKVEGASEDFNDALSEAIQAINQALNRKQDRLTIDSAPVEGSNNPISSDAVYTELAAKEAKIQEKQNLLQFDDTPTEHSENMVKSGSIFEAVDGLRSEIKTNSVKLSAWQLGYFYDTRDGITSVNIESPSESKNYACLVVPCSERDVFLYTGRGSSAARRVAFLSSSSGGNNILYVSPSSSASVEDQYYPAPQGTAYAIFNVNTQYEYEVRKSSARLIYEGNNLNNFLEPGLYVSPSTDRTATLINLPPVTNTSFVLDVEKMPILKGRIVQTYRSAVTNYRYYYYRIYADSAGFTDWIKLYDHRYTELEISSLGKINSGDDLNNYVVPGSYYCTSNTVAKTLLNSPLFVPSSFSLWVVNSKENSANNYKRQILFGNKISFASVYTRVCNNGDWGPWNLLVSATTLESPVLLDLSQYIPSSRLTGTVKRTIRVGTNNVAHYWLQGQSWNPDDYLANHPDRIVSWRRWLMQSNIDILYLQECEDRIDSAGEKNAFNTLYSLFFDSDTNVDTSSSTGMVSDFTSPSRRKILNRLGLNTNSTMVTVPSSHPDYVHKDGYFNWCTVNLDNVGIILLVNIHNFAGDNEYNIDDRANYLNTLRTFIQNSSYDYFIIAGDTNAQSDTDYANILDFCSRINATPVNGGAIGWFRTQVTEEAGKAYDNIIVSSNIRVDNIECDPLLVPGRFLHTDHTPVIATISFM